MPAPKDLLTVSVSLTKRQWATLMEELGYAMNDAPAVVPIYNVIEAAKTDAERTRELENSKRHKERAKAMQQRRQEAACRA